MNAHQALLEAPYQDRYAQQDFEEAACEEHWDDCAAEYAVERYEYLLDSDEMADLVKRVARLSTSKVADEVARGWGEEMLGLVRAYQAKHESTINAMCIERAEQYRREARDFMRGGE